MHNKGYKTGYTLIEVLIAVGIFFTVVAGPTGLFIFSLRNQSNLLGAREMIDNSTHVMGYMSRALRMAKKELNCPRDQPDQCACLKSQGYGYNYEITRSGAGIKFNNSEDPSVCQEFYWDSSDKRLKEVKGSGNAIALTSDDLEVASFKVQEIGSGQDDDLQPKITIFLDIIKKGQSEDMPELKIQTTVSQRNLDVMY